MRPQTNPAIIEAAARLAAAGYSARSIARTLKIGRATLARAHERKQLSLATCQPRMTATVDLLGDDEIETGHAPAWITDEIVREDYAHNVRLYGETFALREARSGMAAVRAEAAR